MKKEVSKPILLLLVAVLALVVGFMGWRAFGGGAGAFDKTDAASIHQLQQRKEAREDR